MKKAPSRPCSLRLIHDGKLITGTAAMLAHVSAMGGWDVHYRETVTQVVEICIATLNQRMPTNAHTAWPRLRVVGGAD